LICQTLIVDADADAMVAVEAKLATVQQQSMRTAQYPRR
jgi:hypothetical protein